MKSFSHAALLTAILALPATAQDAAPQSGTYVFDPEHSHIAFSFNHMGFSESHGLVRGLTGTLVLDAQNPGNSTVEASFPLSQMMTMSAELDKHLTGADWFDTADPASEMVTFTSTGVMPDGDEARVTGDLTVNGTTVPVTLEIELEKSGVNPIAEKPALGFSGEAEVMRSDFGLGGFAPDVSDAVDITVAVEAFLQD